MIEYRFDLKKGADHWQFYLVLENQLNPDEMKSRVEEFRPKFERALPECIGSEITMTESSRNYFSAPI